MTNTATTATQPVKVPYERKASTSHARPTARAIDSMPTDARIHMASAADIIEHVLAGTIRDGVGGTNPDAAFIAMRLRQAAELLTAAATWVENGR